MEIGMERDDPGSSYLSVEVERGVVTANGGQTIIETLNFNQGDGSESQRWKLRKSLWFKGIAERELAINEAHDGTCEWLLHTPQYTTWMASPRREWQHGLLWIKGNAGAGKSTMMKYAVEHAKQASRGDDDHVILSHFFNARGSALEQSTEGMYRTLLWRFLGDLPQEAVADLEARYNNSDIAQWQVAELGRLLKDAVQLLPIQQSVSFYIDALDECKEDEVRDMLKVFRNLIKSVSNTGRRVQVCFASRPHPNVGFTDAMFLNLGEQAEHIRDMERYINDELNIAETATSIRDKLRRKASGSFMWVVLVVQMLNKAFDRGRVHELNALLDNIPTGLHELFRHTLERYPEDRDALLVTFQWLLFTDDAYVVQLWWGIQLGLQRPRAEVYRDFRALTEADMERYIIDISKGLVEVRGWKCQFVHESVRDFILDERQLRNLYNEPDRETFEGRSHERLRDCFVVELEEECIEGRAPIRDQRRGRDQRSVMSSRGWNPLARPTASQLMEHVEAAQICGRDQSEFLKELIRRFGPHLISPDGLQRPLDRPTQHSLIGLLLEHNCPRLIKETQITAAREARCQGLAFGLGGHGMQSPVRRAVDHGQVEAVGSLVDIYINLEPRNRSLQRILIYLADTARLRHRERRFHPSTCALLDIAVRAPGLATFFLLVLAPSETLDPHLDKLEKTTRMNFYYQDSSSRPQPPTHLKQWKSFFRTINLFIRKGLRSDAIDLTHPSTYQWVHGKSNALSYRDDWKDFREHATALTSTRALLRETYPALKDMP